ncbi:hypothetical protein DVJ78_17095 [Humibacter sp. BT305]|nr:hypothetical protein DVJ78_17095 [Humibacter sp. BT305]
MSESAFAVGSMSRFHEIVSARSVLEAQDTMLAELHAEGFAVAAPSYADGIWSVRYAEIGDDRKSNWSEWGLEVFPLLSLVGVRRHIARCAVPVAVTPTATGSRLITHVVWGFRGDGGSVRYAARRLRDAAERASDRLGGVHREQLSPFDGDAPVHAKAFNRLTGWRHLR